MDLRAVCGRGRYCKGRRGLGSRQGQERGVVDDIFDNPKEEYTRQLLSAIPRFEPAAGS